MSFKNRRIYHLATVAMVILGFIYCALVYSSGIASVEKSGYQFLIGIPNYYFFYLVILPFVSSGIVYIAVNNINIRFFGELSDKLPGNRKRKLLRYRRTLFFIAIIISVWIAANDALEKGRTLPPYAIDFSSLPANSYTKAVEKYFLLKKSAASNKEQQYFDFLVQNGYSEKSITGFSSLPSWYKNSSYIYKMETMLSWFAALVVSLFFAQLLLFVIAKDYVSTESKNLILWLVILCSFWVPTKIFSVYYYSLAELATPGIVWFAVILLILGIFVALFIKVERNDMTKYAGYIAAVASAAITALSIYYPELLEDIFSVVETIGWVYGSVLLFIMGMVIYLITDHLIQSYEDSQSGISRASVPDNSPSVNQP